jgi:transposase
MSQGWRDLCGKNRLVKKNKRFTGRFCEEAYRLTSITTNQEAGWFLRVDDESIYRIDKEILEEKAKEQLSPPPAALNMSVDEVSYRKYHRYLTNVIDTDRRLLIWNAKGRKAEVLSLYYKGIGEESCLKIESVAMDGARTYISSTQTHAKNAMIVYDKFHIVQKLNKTVDAVRKAELRKARKENNKEVIEFTNSKQRFILFKKKANLTDNQSKRLEALCQLNEPIYKAMLLKESFLNIYNPQNTNTAEELLKDWLNDASNSELEAFQELAKSFTDKMQFILNWFKKRISSAISEGFNNKIKRLKRMAYGYRDIDYFRLKIHQHCGLLNPRIAT